MSDKSEEATPKRLRKAQEEGDSPTSSFATQSVAFLAAVAIAPGAVAALAAKSSADIRAAVARAGDASPAISMHPATIGGNVLALALPILLAASMAAAVTSVVQSGGVIAAKKLTPKLDRLDVFAGMKQLVSPTRLVAVLRAALFGAGVALVTWLELRAHAADLARSAGSMADAALVAGTIAVAVAWRAAVLGVFLAVLDVVVTRRSWAKRLRMSKDEVKREHKESEGDPELKHARDRAHREMMTSATIAAVKDASVVVVNPTHVACALRYDEGGEDKEADEAPVLIASGQGELAEKIIEAARQYGVPVLRDVPLARALLELEIGTAIPEALYEAVAEILRAAWEEDA